MLRRVISFLFIITIINCVACTNTSTIRREVLQLQSRPIDLPLGKMIKLNNHISRQDDLGDNNKLKLIHYISSSECSICEIETLLFWDVLLDSLNRSDIDPIVIIDPGIRFSIGQIKNSYLESSFSYPVYIDTGAVFLTTNPHIPKDNTLHTFLVDENNNVVIVGNPINNQYVKELLNDYIIDEIKR